MRDREIPFDVWLPVIANRIERLQVQACAGGGFLILTAQDGREYDDWVETLDEVYEILHDLRIEWPRCVVNGPPYGEC